MKIFCVGRNYVKHIEELRNEIPVSPAIFMKYDNALLQDKIFQIPDFSKEIHHEIELVFRFSKRIPRGGMFKFPDCFDGITVGIDFTARDIQDHLKEKRLSWEISKAFDGSAVVGTFRDIKLFPDIQNIEFRLDVNKKTIQKSSSALMIFKVNEIVSYLLKFFSIEKGDLLFTGTPEGVGKIKGNDLLEGYLMDEKLFEIFVNE